MVSALRYSAFQKKRVLTILYSVRFQVLVTASMKFRAFWNVLLCSQVDIARRFRGAYCVHHQGDES
jgi:hypothetical protein